MRQIYLDSNILIAHYSTDEAEDTKKKMVENALAVFAELKDIQLCTSMWAVTEMVNVLVSRKNMDPGVVAQIENKLVSERRLRNLKVYFAEVSPQRDYDFREFFLPREGGYPQISFWGRRRDSQRHYEEQRCKYDFDLR